MSDTLLLVIGILCAGLGGELFVRGVVGLAEWARVPPGLIGATIAAFATSSPELTVAVTAARAGEPVLSFGDALGSNVMNISVVLAVGLIGGAIVVPRGTMRRDLPTALLAPIVTALLVLDGSLSRLDGILLLGLFAVWLGAAVAEARSERGSAGEVLGEPRRVLTILWTGVGLILLITAGRLIVVGAKGVALALGLDEFVVGATVVALATSSPELATTIVAQVRGHAEVGLGTLLGSNVFNNLFIVGVATVISPFSVDLRAVAVGLGFGAVAVAAVVARGGVIQRRRIPLLLALFAAYVVAILQQGP